MSTDISSDNPLDPNGDPVAPQRRDDESPVDDPGEDGRTDGTDGTDGSDRSNGSDGSGRSRSAVIAIAVLEWVVVIAGALAVAMVMKIFLFQVFWIPSGSMEHTLDVGDRVIVNKLSYRLHDINRGDIVVFERPEDHNEDIKDLIKRVIALPGEEVSFDDGAVYIDGERLDEPYLATGTESIGHSYGDGCKPEAPCEVPDGDIWVMGDNRANSQDSTYFGPIAADDVVGRAFFRIWPLDRIGFL